MSASVAGVITPSGGLRIGKAYGAALTAVLASRVRAARDNFHAFAEFVMRDEKGRGILQDSLHRVMHLHVDCCWRAGMHAAIVAPFGHGKTIQLPVGRVCWELGRDVTLRVKIVSNNDPRAMERVMGCTALMFSPAYQLVFPNVRPVPLTEAKKRRKQAKMTQHEVFLDRPGMALDPSIQAAGVLSGGTGGRCDLLVFDDICDQKNALDEPTMRDKVIQNVENVWMQRVIPTTGRVLYVGTPWHQADATHMLMDNPAWSVLECAISDDFKRIDMRVYNPPKDYPLPVLAGAAQKSNGVAGRDWVQVESSHVGAVHYDGEQQELHVRFLGGGHYKYREVPKSLYDQLLDSGSKGGFLNTNIRGIFPHERVDPAVPDPRGPGNGVVKRFTAHPG